MSKFDFMAFGYYAGSDDCAFVAHAKKYSAAQVVDLCKREYEYKFRDHTIWAGRPVKALRAPTVDDVQQMFCAFRFGVSPEWPDGCYTLTDRDETGAFPVHVIDFEQLRAAQAGEGEHEAKN